jgi:hypothetical protein
MKEEHKWEVQIFVFWKPNNWLTLRIPENWVLGGIRGIFAGNNRRMEKCT